MLDIKAQSQLAEATASMMRAYAFATARAAGASALQGMCLWSQMLRSTAERPVWLAAALGNGACAPTEDAPTQVQAAQSPSATEPPFASYRSSGGHAVAQVVLP